MQQPSTQGTEDFTARVSTSRGLLTCQSGWASLNHPHEGPENLWASKSTDSLVNWKFSALQMAFMATNFKRGSVTEKEGLVKRATKVIVSPSFKSTNLRTAAGAFCLAILSCLPQTESNAAAADQAQQPSAGHQKSSVFCGLGDLPGGTFESHAWGVSANGKVVVGSSCSQNGQEEAFRWTLEGGMEGLGGFRDDKQAPLVKARRHVVVNP